MVLDQYLEFVGWDWVLQLLVFDVVGVLFDSGIGQFVLLLELLWLIIESIVYYFYLVLDLDEEELVNLFVIVLE